jgi:hypothetical protein
MMLRLRIPALALTVAALALTASSTALADPIVEIGPLGTGGTTVSGSASEDPSASVCVGDDQLDLDLLGSGLVVPTEAVCAASADGTTSVTDVNTSSNSRSSTSSSGSSTSTNTTAAAGTVSAAQAVGLRIVRVRTDLKRVRANKRFRLFVTLKDRSGRLVHGATVSVARVRGRATASGLRAVKSNRAGTAQVGVRVKRAQFGKRLFVRVAARTPKARAGVLRTVRLPRLG